MHLSSLHHPAQHGSLKLKNRAMKTKIKYFSDRWQLTNLQILNISDYTGNYVAKAFSTMYDRNVVLKISRSSKALAEEQKALTYFDGNGCVRLLDYDLKQAALLLEWIEPGTQLKSLFFDNQEQAVTIAASVIKQLHQQPLSEKTHSFKTIGDWLKLLENFKSISIPQHLLIQAHELAQKLLKTQSQVYVLHGDLHYENILQNNGSWIAIDPQGIVGELACEFSTLVRNPIPELVLQKNPLTIMTHTINMLSSIFQIDQHRIFEWSFVKTVLSACWAEQDNYQTHKEMYIQIAQLLDNVLE